MMYDYYDNSSPIKIYLNNHCRHMLIPPTGNTGVLQSYFDASN